MSRADSLLGALPNQVLVQLHFLRSALFYAEFLPLHLLRKYYVGAADIEIPKDFEKTLFNELIQLYERDIENIKRGYYPASLLLPKQTPLSHIKSLGAVLVDSVKVARRRKNKVSKDFSDGTDVAREDVPDYYKRNFHFQTDGYFSAESSELYDHQVELLFRGSAAAMRRLFLPSLKEHFLRYSGKPYKVLEVACGNGSASEQLLAAIPRVELTCLDLSSPYLKSAQKRLKKYDRVNFVRGDAGELNFQDEQYDAHFSVFLHHELPIEERKKVINEAYRVLKPGGYFAIVDSIQWDESEELNFALENFPKDFHEPFYKNYVMNPVEDLIKEAGFEGIKTDRGFLTKVAYGYKPKS